MEAEVDLRTIGGSLCPPRGSSRKPLRHNSDWILFSTLSQPFKIGPLCGIIDPNFNAVLVAWTIPCDTRPNSYQSLSTI
jgi:hypothetical protein